MAIYTLHAEAHARDAAAAAERLTTLRQGFSWAGLVFGPLWLFAKGLWRPLALWVLLAAAVGFALRESLIGVEAALALYALAALVVGLDGRAMQAAALERGGRPLADVVAERDVAAAERTALARAFNGQAPHPPPSPPHRPTYGEDVIGLFPEAGRR